MSKGGGGLANWNIELKKKQEKRKGQGEKKETISQRYNCDICAIVFSI